MHILDNECSYDLKTMFTNTEVKHQLVLPHTHRRNVDKIVIHVF